MPSDTHARGKDENACNLVWPCGFLLGVSAGNLLRATPGKTTHGCGQSVPAGFLLGFSAGKPPREYFLGAVEGFSVVEGLLAWVFSRKTPPNHTRQGCLFIPPPRTRRQNVDGKGLFSTLRGQHRQPGFWHGLRHRGVILVLLYFRLFSLSSFLFSLVC